MYLSCHYGIGINNTTELNQLLHYFLTSCAKEENIKEIKDNWNLTDMRFPEEKSYDMYDSVRWITLRLSSDLQTHYIDKGVFIGYDLKQEVKYEKGYLVELTSIELNDSESYRKADLETALGSLAKKARIFVHISS